MVDVGGTAYTFGDLDCPISRAGIAVNAQDGTGGFLFISGGPAAYDLFLGLSDGSGYAAGGLEFLVTDQRATWSGTLPAVGGQDAAAAIVIACP